MTPEFCLIFFRGRSLCARVAERRSGRRSDKWRLILGDGAEISYPENRVLYTWRGEPPWVKAGDGKSHSLAKWFGELEARAARFDLAALRSQSENEELVPFERLAKVALTDGGDPWSQAALFFALTSPASPFRLGPEGFTPFPEDEAARRAGRVREKESRMEWKEKVKGWREALRLGHWPPEDGLESGEADEFFSALESLLTLEKRSPFWSTLAKPLGIKSGPMADHLPTLKNWLEIAGRWRDWPAVWLTGAGVPPLYDPALEAEAERSAAIPLSVKGRTDFRGTPTFSIDTQGTHDVDDAISMLTQDAEGMTVAVHISHPFQGLEPDGGLFAEAARRISTVYTEEGIFPMLPHCLSAQRFSLLAGQERETVTFCLRIQGGAGRLIAVEPALVRVERNLDYAGANDLIETHPESWGLLAEACQTLAEERLNQGAHAGTRNGVEVDLSNPERLRLSPYDRRGVAQTMVEELAVLTNREAGRYCQKHGLPALYRVQEGAAPLLEDAVAGKAAPVRTAPSRFSVSGAPHAGVACDRYVQVTSPLRRFADLVMQRQIITHALEGRPAFPRAEQLTTWGEEADRRLALHAEVEHRIEAHWKRKYLTQNPGLTFNGIVRRAGGTRVAKVYLEEVGLTVDGELPRHLRTGDNFPCRVTRVDLDRERALVEPA